VSDITIRILGPDDRSVLENVAPDVFDGAIDSRWAAEFLNDPRHHLAVALDPTGTVVGFASGVHYVHPDKPPQLFVNEVGVAPTHQGRALERASCASSSRTLAPSAASKHGF
jgi:Acetyltransferase (GNAT) family